MVCLDSDVIINFLRNEKSAVTLITQLEEQGVALHTTTVNSFELWKGYYKNPEERVRTAVRQFLDAVTVLPFDIRCSQKAAEIFELLQSRGEMVDVLDVMISSIALIHNECLVTLNKKHFERIPGLSLYP